MWEFLKSSDGSGRLSGRVQSVLFAVLPVLLLASKAAGYEISDAEGKAGADLLIQFVTYGEGIVAICWHLYSWAMRNYRKNKNLGAFALPIFEDKRER